MLDESRHAHDLLTGRLSLRRPSPDDIDAIHAIHSDPATCLHNPSDALSKREEATELFHRWDDHWQRFGYGYWTVRRQGSDRPLGFCGTKTMDLNGMSVLNLFYRFETSSWGQGLATEAATAVVDWVTQRAPELPVIARVRPANTASQRVAIRAGLVRAAHLDLPGEDGLGWIYAKNLHH
ncbi:acetyltransferase, GNAT family [[Actinomadura] parvosata subsp. kistnae]|uniref:GNAT family N-acetyltransferase n=1 Tax=[Actinomadura] parvosata subsp. kistnae TaxID=1909395 RepID=A0A1U9ZW35_9ACTN|nr:GNAT family N-acetyltransferase [Nonomuraea sp. ATCC 55076]AQZ62171.1 GNAT family N-acetyltransferase [Nonomuraea sp. ATCC 55076]SPL95928.1 acetyltransferase, GNAT family [Actinomadura parvosata subsp. kistnae]